MVDVDLIKPDDPRWKEFLSSVDHDFYHLPEYLQLSGEFEGGQGVAFLAQGDGCSLMIPMLIRPLPEALDAPGLHDAVTPYGYPCPLLYAPDPDPNAINALIESFRNYCIENKIVSFFARLHPLITGADSALATLGQTVTHGNTVYIDLSLPVEEIKSRLRSDHRAAARKTEKLGYKLKLTPDGVETFHDLYRETMSRLSASEFYFFSLDYFKRLVHDLPDAIKLLTYYSPEDEPVCSYMIGVCGRIVQGHLIGTAAGMNRLSPSKGVMHEASLWAKENGYKLYHLGGGLGGKEDSLFQFKRAFSDQLATFKTWRCILMENDYIQLTERSRAISGAPEDEHFFPAYRLGIGK